MRTSIDWENASPTFRNMFQLSNILIAWTTITPLHYQGATAGSEFLTYNAGKLYICLEISMSGGTIIAGTNWIEFYNQANALCFEISSEYPYWDVTAAMVKGITVQAKEENFFFSRFVVAGGGYAYMKFNGYRLNV